MAERTLQTPLTTTIDPITGRHITSPVVATQPVILQPVVPQAVGGQAVGGQGVVGQPTAGQAIAYVGNQSTPQAHETRNLALEAASATGGIDPMTNQPYTPHKAADDTEQVYFEGSPLARGVMGRGIGWCLLGLLIMAIPVALFVLDQKRVWHAPWWFSLAFVVVGLIVFVVPMVKAKTIRYRISNYRIDFERGWFSKTIDTLELWHVEDLRFHQSFIDRILGVGTIVVLSHDDTTPKLFLQSLPNPRPIFSALQQRIIAVKRQGGVLKVDTGN